MLKDSTVIDVYEVNGCFKTKEDMSVMNRATVALGGATKSVLSFISNNKTTITVIAVMALKVYLENKGSKTI